MHARQRLGSQEVNENWTKFAHFSFYEVGICCFFLPPDFKHVYILSENMANTCGCTGKHTVALSVMYSWPLSRMHSYDNTNAGSNVQQTSLFGINQPVIITSYETAIENKTCCSPHLDQIQGFVFFLLKQSIFFNFSNSSLDDDSNRSNCSLLLRSLSVCLSDWRRTIFVYRVPVFILQLQ